MSRTKGHQKSRSAGEPQGGKTHKRFLEQLHEPHEPKKGLSRDEGEREPERQGKHRLKEGRVQHDEADKESEHNRQDRLNNHGAEVRHTAQQ